MTQDTAELMVASILHILVEQDNTHTHTYPQEGVGSNLLIPARPHLLKFTQFQKTEPHMGNMCLNTRVGGYMSHSNHNKH